MTQRTKSFWAKADKFPPILCRLLARSRPGGPAISNQELAERTGLAAFQVAALSRQVDWSGVDLPTVRRFIEACGVNFEDPETYRRLCVYLKGKRFKGCFVPPQFTYLRKHPDWIEFFKPLSQRYMEHARTK